MLLSSAAYMILVSSSNLEVPWRMNSNFAQSVGLSTRVVVVPHHPHAQTDEDIQKKYPLYINDSHIYKIFHLVGLGLRDRSIYDDKEIKIIPMVD
jgi:hypothetical protein